MPQGRCTRCQQLNDFDAQPGTMGWRCVCGQVNRTAEGAALKASATRARIMGIGLLVVAAGLLLAVVGALL